MPRVAALLACAMVVCVGIVASRRGGLTAAAPATSRVALMQMLAEEELPGLGEEMYRHFNLCSSCLAECPVFKEAGCKFGSLKEACLPLTLLESCAECAPKGCQAVVDFIDTDARLNETSDGDNATKVELYLELAWKDAQNGAAKELPKLQTCITGAATVGLA
ncbi:hypothetical protein T484DRAFT_1835490, partial [Baffinella frigidus]